MTDKIKDLTAQLPRLQDSMSSLLVLRSCLALTKFGYTTRRPHRLHRHSPYLNNQTYQQSCLPVSLGGLGFKQSQDHATSSYCASIIGSMKLITCIIGGLGEAEADKETKVGAGLGDEDVRGVETRCSDENGRSDETGRGDNAGRGDETGRDDKTGRGGKTGHDDEVVLDAEAAHGS